MYTRCTLDIQSIEKASGEKERKEASCHGSEEGEANEINLLGGNEVREARVNPVKKRANDAKELTSRASSMMAGPHLESLVTWYLPLATCHRMCVCVCVCVASHLLINSNSIDHSIHHRDTFLLQIR